MSISLLNVNVSVVGATTVQNIGTRHDLIVVQTPTATANALVPGIEDFTQTQLNTRFGASTYARFMIQQWLDSNQTGNNVKAKLDVIELLDGTAATAAAATLTVGGAATAAGTLELSILSEKLFTQNISIASGATAATVGTAIKAAFEAVSAPFEVTDDTFGVVTITATDLGTIGNNYGLKFTGVPAGLTVTLTAGFTGGTVPPTVTGVFDLVGDIRYQGVLWPEDLNANLDIPVDFLDDRFNSSNDILDGVAFHGFIDTLASNKVEVNTLNSPSLIVGGDNISSAANISGPEIVHPIDWTLTEFMAIRARRLTENASIASYVTTNAPNDQFGGISLASLPYFNTPLADTPLTISAILFDSAEQEELNTDGYSVLSSNKAGTSMIAGNIVTTYKTDAAGNSDLSFKRLNFVDTVSVAREFIFVNLKSVYDQSRLTSDDPNAGVSMANAQSIKATFFGLMQLLQDASIIVKGTEATNAYKAATTVTTALATGTATINTILPIVTQLGTINVVLKLSFEV